MSPSSASDSLLTPRAACLAATSRAMFCRIAPTPASYAAKRFCSSASVARASSLRDGAMRSASLPFSSPFRMSRNVLASLPSRNATSGSISSLDGERVGVLRDALRQHGELVRVLDLAQRAAALPDLLRRLLREVEQRVVAAG